MKSPFKTGMRVENELMNEPSDTVERRENCLFDLGTQGVGGLHGYDAIYNSLTVYLGSSCIENKSC
jgi:hypothetical protein